MPKRKTVKGDDGADVKKKKQSNPEGEDNDDNNSSESNYSDDGDASNSSDSVDGPVEPDEDEAGESDNSDEDDQGVVDDDEEDDDNEVKKDSDADSDSDFERQLKLKPIKVNPVWQFEVKELKSAIKAVRRGMPVSFASKKFGMSTSVINAQAANYPVKRSKSGVKKGKGESPKVEEVEKVTQKVEEVASEDD